MTWREAGQLLDRELKALQDGVPGLPRLAQRLSLVPETLLDMEHETNETLDQAVSEFATRRRWPRLSQTERTMLVFRLEYATSQSFLFSSQTGALPKVVPEPSLDIPDESLFQWLLDYAWHMDGFPTLHDTCERLLRAEPFSTSAEQSLSS